ncbi:E2F/DP family winged-helix DNA-binding domain-containing protein [Circinella umbellata]|nr:E2F/DP family winged-helix DNA-binding domain-containing protein [Circinella umbellata]
MTSAFVPFQSDTLPSPPLTTYIHPISTTKLPSLFDHGTRNHKNNILQSSVTTTKTLPSYGYSLPPLQDILSPPPAPPPQLSPPSESEEYPSRKGSIASILNSAPELRQLDEEEFRNGYQSHFNDDIVHPSSLKRGRPRVTYQQHQSSLHHQVSKKRKCHEQPSSEPIPRANKGLRHFSKQVCDKVAEKGVTTYNEVADELALDIRATMEIEGNDKRSFDQKNIRRRVYDALNVLMAMDIIAKDKKQIKWLGIPTCFQEEKEQRNLDELQKQVDQEERRQAHLMSSINRTRGLIRDKLAQHLQLCNLVWRNYHINNNNNNDTEIISSSSDEDDDKVSLPFFIVACPTKQDLTVNVSNDRRSAEIAHASLDDDDANRRVVYEDADVLRHLHLNRITSDQLAAWLPDPAMQSFLSVRHTTDSSIYIQSSADLCATSAS